MQEVVVTQSDGWIDVDLGIESHRAYESEAHIFEVRASHLGREIGFSVGFPTSWQLELSETFPDMPPVHSGAIAIASAGECSHTFISFLAELWGLSEPRNIANLTELGAVILKGNPKNVLIEPIAIKIFFGALQDSTEQYAEMYLNIDYPQKRVEFHEKDPEYRTNILVGLFADKSNLIEQGF